MRVPAECPRCREIDERRRSVHEVSSGKRKQELHSVYLHEMDAADVHSGKLTVRCEQGHTTVVTLPIPAFELLFDFGCSALLDGYPREAVTSFATSFERFEEFTCRFLLARRRVAFEGVDVWWKEVATSSERQKGSFVALWISEFFATPPLLPRKLEPPPPYDCSKQERLRHGTAHRASPLRLKAWIAILSAQLKVPLGPYLANERCWPVSLLRCRISTGDRHQ